MPSTFFFSPPLVLDSDISPIREGEFLTVVSLIDPKRKLLAGEEKKNPLVPFSGNRDRFVIMALDLLLSEPLKESAFKSK